MERKKEEVVLSYNLGTLCTEHCALSIILVTLVTLVTLITLVTFYYSFLFHLHDKPFCSNLV